MTSGVRVREVLSDEAEAADLEARSRGHRERRTHSRPDLPRGFRDGDDSANVYPRDQVLAVRSKNTLSGSAEPHGGDTHEREYAIP